MCCIFHYHFFPIFSTLHFFVIVIVRVCLFSHSNFPCVFRGMSGGTKPSADSKAAPSVTDAKSSSVKSVEINVLMIGRGEYTTGYVPGKGGAAASDKGSGVVGVVMFDLRRRGVVGPRIGLCGTAAEGSDAVRQHFKSRIGDRYGLDTACEYYPQPLSQKEAEDTKAAKPADSKAVVVPVPAYVSAIKAFNAGDVVTIFTPDDTHFVIAMEAISHGCHVLIAKPAVKTLAHHLTLVAHAKKRNVNTNTPHHTTARSQPVYNPVLTTRKHLFVFLSSFACGVV